MTNEMSSILPAAVVLIPAVAGLLIFLLGMRTAWLRELLALLGTGAAFVMSVMVAASAVRGQVLTSFNLQFYADGLSALLIVLVSTIGLIATAYSLKYMRHQVQEGGLPHTTTSARLRAFYGWLMLFLSTMLWACLSNNIVMLWVAVEASTIASGILVGFYWDKRALEAGYKYLMLLTVGITFSLFGCIMVYAAGANILGGHKGLLLSELRHISAAFPATTVALASAFLIVGFGTKAGIAPFHPWLPDAHAEAPTPISALLSGVMLKVALYAMVRTVTLFYPGYSEVASFILALGLFTLIIGDVMALAQDDLKRMLAYSSVSQMGYVLMGFGIGTQIGIYAGLFHLINHGVAKSLLFLSAGAVISATGARALSRLGGLAVKMPVTSFCFFVGALALVGMPPFNGFQSKLALFVAGAETAHWWAIGIGLLGSILTMVVLVKAAKSIFWGGTKSDSEYGREVKEVSAPLAITMVVLALICLGVGLYPRAVYRPISAAASVVETVRTSPDRSRLQAHATDQWPRTSEVHKAR
jgi:hydrogenase-4 component F